jgi:hypothetical protein
MKAISIKQPWASLIVEGIKDIENRTWKCSEKYIGQRVLVHASGKMDFPNPLSLLDDRQRLCFSTPESRHKLYDDSTVRSAIIGSVEIVGCVINHPSIWAEKTELPEQLSNECIWNWVLANPIKFLEPIPVKGKLGFWNFELITE